MLEADAKQSGITRVLSSGYC